MPPAACCAADRQCCRWWRHRGLWPNKALTDQASTSNADFSTSIIHQLIQQGVNVQHGDEYAALDVDRDGKVTSLSDGLMLIRHLFGSAFAGSALTQNAISPDSLYASNDRPWESVRTNINALLLPSS